MKAAFQVLGYNDVYHYFNIYTNVKDCDMWMEAYEAKYNNPNGTKKFGRAEWDKLLGHCAAITDAPCTSFGPELIDAYPEARVVLVQRNFAAWKKSFSLINEAAFDRQFDIGAFLDPQYTGRLLRLVRMWFEYSLHLKSSDEYDANIKHVWEEHYAEIRRIIPKERLLEYELGSGWEPLCTFLGKPVPDRPFPRINEAESLKKIIEVLAVRTARRSLRNVVVVLSGLLAIGYGTYYLFLA